MGKLDAYTTYPCCCVGIEAKVLFFLKIGTFKVYTSPNH